MRLHTETITPALLDTLRKLMSTEVFKDFCLVGGTALSLQRGHRRSIDIDLFTDIAYPEIDTKNIKQYLESNFPIHTGTESLNETAIGYSIFIGDESHNPIKLDLFYTEPFIFPKLDYEGIHMADEKEIAAMKMLAIGSPIKRQKDFWDIHEMLKDYSLEEMIHWGLQRNEYSLTEEDILNGFEMIDQIEESPEGIDTLHKHEYWELKVMDLKEEIKHYKETHK